MRKAIGFALLMLTSVLLILGPGLGIVDAQIKQHTLTLNWTASATPNVTYNICRSATTGGPYSTLQTGVSATSFVDTTGTPGTKYFYVVDSIDSLGFFSPHSNEVSATPLANPAPATGLGVVVN